MSLRSNAYVVFGPFSDEDWNNGVLLWYVVPPFAFIIAMGFILLNSDNGDNGSNLLFYSHSERQIHLMSLAEQRWIYVTVELYRTGYLILCWALSIIILKSYICITQRHTKSTCFAMKN